MGTLNGALSIAVTALGAEQAAISVTSNNVANVNTPGFTRQRAVLTSTDPAAMGDLTFGTGVEMSGIQAIRDNVLELRLQEEEQDVGQYDALTQSLSNLDSLFGPSGTNLDSDLNGLFGSISKLSTDPSSLSLRQAVLTSANQLASSFRKTAMQLQENGQDLNRSVGQSVKQINQLTSQIAGINAQITALEAGTSQASSLLDQRQQLLQQLANLVDISTVPLDEGLSVTTKGGSVLVVGKNSYALDAVRDNQGVIEVFSQGSDITNQIKGGKLGGYLRARDQNIPSYTLALDQLATSLSTAFNGAQAAGFDPKGVAGGILFSTPPGSGVGAALNMTMELQDPNAIAASSDVTGGGNGNLQSLMDVRSQLIVQGETPIDFYSNLVFRVGSDAANADVELQGAQGISRQLEDQRGAISGVSLDEEATNLIRYQRAFEAAARIIDVINELTGEAVNLGRS